LRFNASSLLLVKSISLKGLHNSRGWVWCEVQRIEKIAQGDVQRIVKHLKLLQENVTEKKNYTKSSVLQKRGNYCQAPTKKYTKLTLAYNNGVGIVGSISLGGLML